MTQTAATIHGLERLDHHSAVVVIDVIRAFTTAAAAFDAPTGSTSATRPSSSAEWTSAAGC